MFIAVLVVNKFRAMNIFMQLFYFQKFVLGFKKYGVFIVAVNIEHKISTRNMFKYRELTNMVNYAMHTFKGKVEGQRDGSVVECLLICERPEFNSQQPRGSSQSSLTSVPRYPMPLLTSMDSWTYVTHIHVFRDTAH